MAYFAGCRTAEELKAKYKTVVFELHPDNNPDRDTTKEFQEMQSEYREMFERLKNIHATADGEYYTKETEETASEFMDIIEKLVHIKNITVEIIGSWIWVSGETKVCKDRLKEMNFKFSAKKEAWYYSNTPYKGFWGNYTMNELRDKWGSQVVKDDDDQKRIA